MSNYISGAEALQAMNEGGSGNDNEFSKFNSGTSYLVKVLGTADLMQFYSYGVYKKTHSFIAKNPSVKDKGFPIDKLTSWDEAYLSLRKEDEEYNSKANSHAYQFRAKERYALGFYDVVAGETIVIDFSKNQAQAVFSTITANKDKLDDVVFNLSKSGTSTSTVVSLTIEDNVTNIKKMKDADIEPDTNLTDEAIANFYKAPEEFDKATFEGLLFEADEEDMLKNLHKTGFDVTSIGYEVPDMTEKDDKKEATEGQDGGGEAIGDISDDDLPF